MQPKPPLVVWMRGWGSKGLKSLHLGAPWAGFLFVLRTVSGIYVRIDTSHHIPTARPLPACLRRIAQAPHAVQSELKT